MDLKETCKKYSVQSEQIFFRKLEYFMLDILVSLIGDSWTPSYNLHNANLKLM